jgi:hypothetical protein
MSVFSIAKAWWFARARPSRRRRRLLTNCRKRQVVIATLPGGLNGPHCERVGAAGAAAVVRSVSSRGQKYSCRLLTTPAFPPPARDRTLATPTPSCLAMVSRFMPSPASLTMSSAFPLQPSKPRPSFSLQARLAADACVRLGSGAAEP